MSNKQEQLQYNEICIHCKECRELFAGLNTWLMEAFATYQGITSPYNDYYDWGITHHKCNKLMYNVFPGAGAFTVMLRLPDTQFASVHEQLWPYVKEYVDNRYPCGSSGQMRYRVCEEAHVEDIQ